MRKHLLALTTGALVLAMTAGVGATVAGNANGKGPGNADENKSQEHNFRSPMAKKQDALLQKALRARLNGKASGY